MLAAILNSATLNCAILDLAILHKTLTQTHSFSLNLMMAAILNPAIWDSAILHKKDFNNSFLLNLMMAAILNCAILDSAILVFTLKLTHTCQYWFPTFAHKKTSLTLPSQPFAQKTSLIHSD